MDAEGQLKFYCNRLLGNSSAVTYQVCRSGVTCLDRHSLADRRIRTKIGILDVT